MPRVCIVNGLKERPISHPYTLSPPPPPPPSPWEEFPRNPKPLRCWSSRHPSFSFSMRILRRAASLLLHARAYDAGRTTTRRLQGSFLRVPSGELELKLLRPGNTMEVSMATALDGNQLYTTNTAGEPPAFKYLTGEEEATMKTSEMEGSKKLTEDEEQALKVRFQEWMNKFNRNYKDEAEKAYRFKIFKSTVDHVEKFNSEQVKKYGYCKCILGTNKFADLTTEEALNKFGRGKSSRQC